MHNIMLLTSSQLINIYLSIHMVEKMCNLIRWLLMNLKPADLVLHFFKRDSRILKKLYTQSQYCEKLYRDKILEFLPLAKNSK